MDDLRRHQAHYREATTYWTCTECFRVSRLPGVGLGGFKKVFADKKFLLARDEVARRSMGLITGLPVKDHRELCRSISGEQWQEVEETVDSYGLLPQFALICRVWQRSFVMQ